MAENLDPDLRKLAAYGRKLKNELLKSRPKDLDLQPQADLFRKGELIATVFMQGDSAVFLPSLSRAVLGYDADEVVTLLDTFMATGQESADKYFAGDIPRGTLQKWFESEDPAERARVTEALSLQRWWTKKDLTIDTVFARVEYKYLKHKHRFRFSEPQQADAALGIIDDAVRKAMSAPSVMNQMEDIISFRDDADRADARFHGDVATTKMLLVANNQVIHHVKPENKKRFEESMARLEGAQLNDLTDIVRNG